MSQDSEVSDEEIGASPKKQMTTSSRAPLATIPTPTTNAASSSQGNPRIRAKRKLCLTGFGKKNKSEGTVAKRSPTRRSLFGTAKPEPEAVSAIRRGSTGAFGYFASKSKSAGDDVQPAVKPTFPETTTQATEPIQLQRLNPAAVAQSKFKEHLAKLGSPTKRYHSSVTSPKKEYATRNITHSPVRASPRKRLNSEFRADFDRLSTTRSYAYLPCDLSLKTHFQLKFPRTYLQDIAIQKQATKARSYNISINDTLKCDCTAVEPELVARLQRAVQYYQFPCSPWWRRPQASAKSHEISAPEAGQQTAIENFPRYGKFQNRASSMEQGQLDGFFENYREAFKCLFQGCRNKVLPYFYLCSELFTLVFRSDECVLWPSNPKLKEQLDSCGINYFEEKKAAPQIDIHPKTPTSRNSKKLNRSCSLDEGSMRTPRRRTTSENSTNDDDSVDENELALTPNIKVVDRRRASAMGDLLKASTAHGALVVRGIQQITRLSNFLQKPDYWKDKNPHFKPPTLLSPYNFDHASLKSSEFTVQTMPNDRTKYIAEFSKGVLMPHAIWLLVNNIIRYVKERHGDQPSLGEFELSGSLLSEKSSTNLNYKRGALEDITEENENEPDDIESQILTSSNVTFCEFLRYSTNSKTISKFTYTTDRRFQIS